MAVANLGLRFIVEVLGIAALGYAGYQLAGDGPGRVVAAVAAPLVLIAVWAAVVAPTATSGLSQAQKDVVGTLLILGAAGAVAAAGRPLAAAAFGAVVLANAVLLLVLGQDARLALEGMRR